jgi:alpha-D-ribose 1-methylphosphonate 5-triphosphate diphosphatase PhnM
MSQEIESQVLEFVESRHKKGETTASRHVHIRFDTEIENAEQILQKLAQNGKISKKYDEQYQEDRYSSN